MAFLYNMEGINCGSCDDAQAAPEGYWLRPDDCNDKMSPVDFLDKIGPQRFAAIWSAALKNPTLAFSMMRGFAAQSIIITESFPVLISLEKVGLLPSGTAIEVWS